jgi:16S rRNA (cytidine1402-2'-O)-methyltransferase
MTLSSPSLGTLYLVPNTLDLLEEAPRSIEDLLPLGVLRRAANLQHWLAENAKTTRAFLKRVDTVVPLDIALQQIQITELPRPQKGPVKGPGKGLEASPLGPDLLAPLRAGENMGLISEAGLPGVADPGALWVQMAYRLGARVEVLPGACSLSLALAASGLQGQRFAFVGYLPTEAQARSQQLLKLEAASQRDQQTQMLIETPYRNPALLVALLQGLRPQTLLSVSAGLTSIHAFSHTASVEQWRQAPELQNKLNTHTPAVFCFLAK